MEPFKTHRGLIATLDKANVDTDQIIPKQFLKSIARTGFGESLFYDWRYLDNGKPNPAFSLNKKEFQKATVLVTRNNFGCGSSREHAVWAIMQYGFKAVIAPQKKINDSVIPAFADIFRNNSGKNGLLTIELQEQEVDKIFEFVDRFQKLEATIDLDEQRVVLHLAEEVSFHFDMDPAIKERMIHGLDDIGISLQQEAALRAFEAKHDPQING